MKRSKATLVARVAICTLIVAVSALAISGCGGVKGPATVSFWNSFTGSDADELKALVTKFNNDNKGTYAVTMDIMSQDAFAQKLPAALATKTGPDIMAIGVNDLITYARQGSIWDISDIFAKTGLDKNDLTAPALAFSQVDGKLYGLPLEVFGIYLYWNRDLFKAAGLDPNNPPKTLQELADDAVKLTKASANQFGFAMPVKGAPQFYANFIRGNGGEVVVSGKNAFDTPTNLATVNQLRYLAFEKKVSPIGASGVDMDNVMFSGKLGMYMNGPWLIPGLKGHNINFGVANIPAGSKGASTILDGAIFAIAKNSTGKNKSAAYAFLKYWNSVAVGKAWAQKVGFPPYLTSVINDPDIKADTSISTLAGALSSGIASPWLVGVNGGSRIDSDILFPMIEQLQNGTTAADAVKKASALIDQTLTGSK